MIRKIIHIDEDKCNGCPKLDAVDYMDKPTMKFVVTAFDAGTGLAGHAAPGGAPIFALDGEAMVGHEGKAHPIKAGENFHFAKDGLHSIRENGRFKMALLLTLE